MTEVTLKLSVEPELAEAYFTASGTEVEKIKLLMDLVMRQVISPRKRTLPEIMDAMSDQAEANGLTPEILADLLR